MGPANILIVDDQPENLLALAAVLEPLRHRVVQASSGEEALKRLLEDDFAVILLDVQMPGLDGFETAEYIKRRDRTRQVPIIFLTAIDKESHHVFRGYSVGAVDYLFKPFEPEILRSKVAVFVELHEKTNELRASEERFRTAFAQAPIGIALLNVEGRFVQVNRALGEIVGRSQADLIDGRLTDLFEGPEEERALRRMLDGEIPSHQAPRTVGEVEVQLSVSLAEDADGQPATFIVQVVDLTERARAERERTERLREQAARLEAQAVADTTRKLQAVGDVALRHRGLDDLVQELCDTVASIFGADAAALLLAEPGEETLVVSATSGGRADRSIGATVAFGEGFAGHVAATASAAAAHGPGAAGEVALGRRGLLALIGAPLIVDTPRGATGGEVLGVLEAGSGTEQGFTSEDLDVLRLVADRAALAIEGARMFAREASIAETLQRSLLPARLPRVPGLELAARYLPGEAVGGDWYDAIPLPEGRVVLVMGDVMGRGLPAASLMGQVRNALRAYALEGHGPAAMLERLDRLVALEGDGMVTLSCLVVDPDLTELRYASAGHPPPLLVRGGEEGEASYLDAPASVPLGVGDAAWEEVEVTLEPGSRIVLYTDGLVEERDVPLDAGLEQLRVAALAGPEEPDALCGSIVEALGRSGSGGDDVTVMVAGTVPIAPAALRLVLPAEPSSLEGMRRRLGRWLDELGANPRERREVQMASHEACANSMEHGYAFGEATLELEAASHDGGVAVVVSDRGGWREPVEGGDRGRGLVVMRELMNAVELDPGPEGTRVAMHRKLERLDGAEASVTR
jgi:PAS domain S-box-containing protein